MTGGVMFAKTFSACVLVLVFFSFCPASIAHDASGWITFTFDDGTRDVYEYALPVMAELGIPGVEFPRCDMILASNPYFFTWDELVEIQDVYGWEIGSHTVNHPDLSTLSDADLVYELEESKKILEEQGLFVRGLAIPYGHYDNRVLRFIAKTYDYCRTSDQGENLLWGGEYSDYQIKMHTIHRDGSVDDYEALIDKAVQDGSWLILAFHNIVTGTPVGPLEYNVDDMRSIMEYALATPIEVTSVAGMIADQKKSLVPNFSFESLDAASWARAWSRGGDLQRIGIDENDMGNCRSRRTLRLAGAADNQYAVSDLIPVETGETYRISFFIDQVDFVSGSTDFFIQEQTESGGQVYPRNMIRITSKDDSFVGTWLGKYQPSDSSITHVKLVFCTSRGSDLTGYIDSVLMKKML